jgi:Na+/proline symporter
VPTRAAVVVFMAAIAASMSTADSVLLSLGSLGATDLLHRPLHAAATTRLGKRATAALFVAMIALSMRRDLTLWRLIELKMEILVQCAPAFLLGIIGPVCAAGQRWRVSSWAPRWRADRCSSASSAWAESTRA